MTRVQSQGTPMYNSDEGALLTLSAQAAGTVLSSVRYNPLGALRVVVNITSITGSLTVSILLVDQASGATVVLLASAAIAATGTTVLKVAPGLAASANAVANDYGGPFIQVQAVVATGPCTATISAHFLGDS
jgi:hypothetical protein